MTKLGVNQNHLDAVIFGAHESTRGGLFNALTRAREDGCEALQIFSKAPAAWKAPEIGEKEAEKFRSARAKASLGPLLVHDSYLINPCSAKVALRRKSWDAFRQEANRCDLLGAEYMVFHPGSPGDLDEEQATELVAHCILEAIAASENVIFLIENTAGQGKSIGHRFEHLAAIVEKAGSHDRVGVCLDTCHLFAAGYDLGTPESARSVLEEFDATIGAERLMAFHLNDSKKPLGSRVDRHALIGQGAIGLALFRWLGHEPRFADMPGILETPVEKGETYKNEIAILRGL